MYKCSCGFETSNHAKFAGHRSGHSRRNELFKAEFACKECSASFSKGQILGAHVVAAHRRKRVLEFHELKSNAKRKHRLIEERGHRCERCHLSVWQDVKIPLEMDHIDGNTENNDKTNLRLLCCNCHALTPTYKGKNIGKANTARAHYYRRYNSQKRIAAGILPAFKISEL